jgi:hypothetical protein
MAPTFVYTAASAAGQPGAGLAALDWLASHPVIAGILLGLAAVAAHLAGCDRCRSRRRERRRRRTTARDRVLGRSSE